MTLLITDSKSGHILEFKDVKEWNVAQGGLFLIDYENGEKQILSPFAFSQICIKNS